MNENLRKFLSTNAYPITVAFISLIVSFFATYVSLQLWQQATVYRIQANEQRLTNLETNLADRQTNLQQFRVMQTQIQTILDNQKQQDSKLDKITDYLLTH